MPGLVQATHAVDQNKMSYFHDFENIMMHECQCLTCSYLQTSSSNVLQTCSKQNSTTYDSSNCFKQRKMYRSKSLDSTKRDSVLVNDAADSVNFYKLVDLILSLHGYTGHQTDLKGLNTDGPTLKRLARAKILDIVKEKSNSGLNRKFTSVRQCPVENSENETAKMVDEIFFGDMQNTKSAHNDSSANSWNPWNGNTIQLEIPGNSDKVLKRQFPRMSYQYLLFSRGNSTARAKFFQYFTETKGFLGHTGKSCIWCGWDRRKPLYQR